MSYTITNVEWVLIILVITPNYSEFPYYELCELEVYGEFTMIKISNNKLFKLLK